MATRGGGFGGFGLDPFGSGAGSLSRYNLGETVSSLEALEAYATALGWANGTVSDDEYLASLQKQIDLAAPGSREKLSAQDKYDDAVYTIARNKIVNRINAATSAERVDLMRELIAHDRARLGAMNPDNEQYRELQTRIASSRADIRQTQYGDLVEKVNRGKASVSSLLAMAQRFYDDAVGDPDREEWRRTVGELRDRVADERLADSYQSYQHNRLEGRALLRQMDARLAELEPGSPQYIELSRQREDLAESIRREQRAKDNAELQKLFNSGGIKDSAYIAKLKADVEAEKPGTTERIEAENRLRQATFSLAEDKLRYDVSKGKEGAVGRLTRFYRSYQATMVRGSAEWRQLDLAIASLKGGRYGGGGGGGGGAGGGGGKFAQPPKVISPAGDFGMLVNGAIPGVKVPPDLGALLNINPRNGAQAKWFDNARRTLLAAQQAGDDTWLYVDQKGKSWELPFSASMLQTIDAQNVRYMQYLVRTESDPKKRATAVGKMITALKAYRLHGGQIAMSDYEAQMSAINSAKEKALAQGDYAVYANLALAQADLIRGMLMVPEGQPLDVAQSQNPALTEDMRGRIARDLDAVEPAVFDPEADGYHPRGDPVIGSILDGAIVVEDRDGDGTVDTATADPRRGYVTQDPSTGQVVYVKLDEDNANDYVVVRGADGKDTGETRPAYYDTHVRIVTRDGDILYQPKQEGGALAAPVRVMVTTGPVGGAPVAPAGQPGYGSPQMSVQPGYLWAPPSMSGQAFQMSNPAAPKTGVRSQARQQGSFYTYLAGSVPLPGVAVREGGRVVWYVSLDGVNYLRYEGGSGSKPPQVVINPDRMGAVGTDANGNLTINGEAYVPGKHGPLGQYLHFYGTDYRNTNGDLVPAPEASGSGRGIGAPGAHYPIRKLGADGALYTGPDMGDMDTVGSLREEKRLARQARLSAGLSGDDTRESLLEEKRRTRGGPGMSAALAGNSTYLADAAYERRRGPAPRPTTPKPAEPHVPDLSERTQLIRPFGMGDIYVAPQPNLKRATAAPTAPPLRDPVRAVVQPVKDVELREIRKPPRIRPLPKGGAPNKPKPKPKPAPRPRYGAAKLKQLETI